MKLQRLGWVGLQKFVASMPAAAAAAGMLLVFLAPVLDHHFAELQFGHGHVYLGSDAPGHVHFYDDSRRHSHGPFDGDHLQMIPEDETESSRSIVIAYLTSSDGIGPAFSGLSGPLADQEFGFNELGNVSFLRTPSDEAFRIGAIVPAPKKPPRI